MKNIKISILVILISAGLSSCFYGGGYAYNDRHYRYYRPYNYSYRYYSRPNYYNYDRRRDNDRQYWDKKQGKSRGHEKGYSYNRGKKR